MNPLAAILPVRGGDPFKQGESRTEKWREPVDPGDIV